MTCLRAAFLTVLTLAPAAGWAATAEGPQSVFESLFGAECRRVQATATKADDAALAGKVLKTAEGKGVKDDLFAFLCARAHDLGAGHRDGWPTAVRAMGLLARKDPPRRAEFLAKAAPLLQHVYDTSPASKRRAAGGELLACFLDAAEAEAERGHHAEAIELARKAARQAAAGFAGRRADIQIRIRHYQRLGDQRKEAAEIQDRLAKKPGEVTDADRSRLVYLHCVCLDDPAAAARLGRAVWDAETHETLLAAAEGPGQASQETCLAVGKWYAALAAKEADPAARRWMYRRAWRFYRRFLHLHKNVDVRRAEAVAATKDMLRRIFATRFQRPGAKGKSTFRAGRAAELLRLPRLAQKVRDARLGAGGLALNKNWYNNCSLPCLAEGSYHVTTKLVCAEAPKQVGLLLPVGPDFIAFVVGTDHPRGALVGRRMGTTIASAEPLAGGLTCDLDAVVLVAGGAAEVFAQVNDTPQLYWAGPTWDLSIPDWEDHGRLIDGCVTLHGHSVAVRTSSVKLRMLTGTARPLR